MRLPPQKKILREDLKDAPSWISVVINVVNSFMGSTYNALNKNITYPDNIACQIKLLTVKTTAAYPTMEEITFQSELSTKAIGCNIMQVFEKSTYTPPTGAVTVNWIEDNGTIVIKNITGLDVSKTYMVRLIVT